MGLSKQSGKLRTLRNENLYLRQELKEKNQCS